MHKAIIDLMYVIMADRIFAARLSVPIYLRHIKLNLNKLVSKMLNSKIYVLST
jgi:hypothetical protein